MPTIDVEILPGQFVPFEIRGEKPNYIEMQQINKLAKQAERSSLQQNQAAQATQQEQLFDTKTGVKSGSLRAVLSMAETAEEEDAKLTELFGMSKDTDFLRDNRGRLALTPEGGKKVGVDLAQNTLIDEEGLSRYDFADLASMGADIAGGIYGTVKGAALGSAMGPVGTFLGGALGAGTGTAASGAIEEAIEGMLGVSRQSAGEITKDLALDFGIGAAGEVVIGGAIKIAAPFVRGLRGKRLEGEELQTVGMGLADEKASKRILLAQAKEISEKTGRPVDEVMTEISGPTGMGFGETRVGFGGLAPTLDTAGGTAIGARAQRIGEKIRGTSQRLINNYKTLNDTFNTYKSQLGLSADAPISQTIADEAGEVLKAGIQGKNQALRVAEEEARMGVLNQFDELTKELGAAAKSDDSINNFVFQSLAKSLNQFDQLATSKYAAIDKVMKDTVGDAEIFLTSDLKKTAKKLKTRYTPSIRASTGIPDKLADEDLVANAIIQGFEGLGDKASFAQLYLLRKKLWDTNFAFKGMNGTDKLDDAIRQIDGMMTEQAVKNVAISPAASSLSADSVQLLNNAAEQLAPARKFYLDGMTKIDNMTRATGLKELRDNVVRSRNSGTPIEDLMPNVTLMSKIIKNGDAQSVTKTLDVIRANAPKGQKDKLTNEFRERLATEWLTNAAKKTSFKADDAYAFKGSNFSQQIDDLGATGDVLFGKERYAKIKNLADQIRQTTIPGRTSKVDVENALMMARSTGAKQPFVNALQNVAKAQKEAYDFQNNSIRKKILANEDIDAGVAASYISGPAKTNEVKSIMNSLDDAGREKVQQFFLSQLTQDFGVSALVDGKALQGMSKAFSAAAEKGKLRAVFGKETGIDMEKFAKILAANAKTAQGGDLIAANIAASPLANLGSIIRATLVTRILDSAPIYRRVVRDYERMSKGLSPKSKSELLGQLIGAAVAQTPGQALQEGVNEASKQIRAIADNSGLTEQLSAIRSKMTPPNTASSLGGINVTQPTAPAGTSTIRQQAAANPGVAQTLGIRGPTAGLLGTGNP
tara:strand:+ start:1832 stop:4966 length:3135 start_codon:yes stop_codon:yes gene_type:complete